MKRTVSTLCALAAVAALSACAALGLASLDTFEKRVLGGYATIQTVNEGAEAAFKAGKLAKSDAENVVSTSRALIAGLMVAQELHVAACPAPTPAPATCEAPAAEAKLRATLALLTAMQAYVATKGQS